MNRPAARIRFAAAIAGCFLFLASSLMPLLGAQARWEIRCGEREFSGQFDDCFRDMLPVMEMFAPVAGLLLVLPFAAFAANIWAVPLEEGRLSWLNSGTTSPEDNWPVIQLAGLVGAVWAFAQTSAYHGHAAGQPFLLFWSAFGLWFLAAALCALPDWLWQALRHFAARIFQR